uniref:Methylmalonyl-CoA carboxyltransferase 1.3S subunit n=1 Tax=Candidatus Kentrum sp. LPFa TaxID=2126335 RepID=A0A450XNB8_9GAMM|nr:MAG: methylmalonyl-CoA carboxyltransferase 1.3S subunit [Candidatus Kentron sp. LPFa]VFK19311.1 MAG: methylmalonyl-CoA carboxyltransferase 1.3S subunit [Candidatus Kentron sp. LPFa]VFK30746.1 MAG: methylmalonyl-CoA carboxyltransferase 1.3S subunit [Candidatus Kentron sp. LPFa]
MKLRITLDGVTYDLDVEFVDEGGVAPPSGASGSAPKAPPSAPASSGTAKAAPKKPAPSAAVDSSEKTIASPLSGTVFKVLSKVGDVVEANQDLLILEAMKMETNVVSTIAGTIKNVAVAEGDAVSQGQLLIEFE